MNLCSKLFLRFGRERIFASLAIFFAAASSEIYAQPFTEIFPESKSFDELASFPQALSFDANEFAKPLPLDRQNRQAGISLSVMQSTVPLDIESLMELSKKAASYPSVIVAEKKPNENVPEKIVQKKSQPAADHEVLVMIENGTVLFSPPTLTIDPVETKLISLKFADLGLAQRVGVFSRNSKVAVWNEARSGLSVKGSGKTEVFVASQNFMGILPIEVLSKDAKTVAQLNPIKAPASPNKKDLFGLEVPDSLVSLDSTTAQTRASYGTSTTLDFAPEMTEVQGSTALTDAPIHLTKKQEKTGHIDATLRFVDERSSLATKQFFGISGLLVSIPGTEFKGVTDQLGMIQVRDIPKGSRFLVQHSDPSGRVASGIYEARVENDAQEILVPVRRQFNLQENLNSLGIQLSDNNHGTICGQVLHSKSNLIPLQDISVTLDVQARGPFYVNPYGFFDGKLYGTKSDGFFCFFDVERGPVNVSFFSNQNYLGSAVTLVEGQRHTEEKFFIGERLPLRTHLFVTGSAADQLNSNRLVSNRKTPVDMASVMAIGTGDLFLNVDDGVIRSTAPLLAFKDNAYTLSQSGEFEDVLYKNRLSEPSQNQFLTLYPRGYIEDMSVYAQTYQDQGLGSVIAEHAALDGQGLESPEIHLVDAYGRDVGEGWMFADGDISKAIFFNVPYGVYTLTVHTHDGNWIASDTIVVYSGTSSFVRTGSRSIVKSDQLSAAN